MGGCAAPEVACSGGKEVLIATPLFWFHLSIYLLRNFFLRIIYKFHRLLSTKRFVLHSVQNNCKRANYCGGKEVVKLVELGDKRSVNNIEQ